MKPTDEQIPAELIADIEAIATKAKAENLHFIFCVDRPKGDMAARVGADLVTLANLIVAMTQDMGEGALEALVSMLLSEVSLAKTIEALATFLAEKEKAEAKED